jgi:hypothetical protein
MDYICSGGGSQELRKFTGDRSVFGCVLTADCPDGILPELKPKWLSFVDRAGFASFQVRGASLGVRLVDRSGVVFHQASLSERKPDPDVALEPGWEP